MAGNKLGAWAFIIGLLLAVVLGLGLTAYEQPLVWLLFVVGILVGLLNVTARETQSFLTAGTILALLAFLGVEVGVFENVVVLLNILKGVLALFIPATVVVALKAVYELAKD